MTVVQTLKNMVAQEERALKRLRKYCESGAIVGADFRKFKPTHMLVGEIEPNSKVEAKEICGHIYKVVQLKNAKEIFYKDYPLLEAIQPRQTTITGWPKAQEYLEAILENKELRWVVDSLHPVRLEVICYEYLRMEKILDALLLPIGRTLQDIDILGINGQGKYIKAQVTHSDTPKEIKEKLNKLKLRKSEDSEDSRFIFFGPDSQEIYDEDIEYISIEKVFDRLTSDRDSVYYKMIQKMLGIKHD